MCDVDLSVIVPAYNGERTIADCLASIERATDGRRREIIVVDSGTDATSEIVRQRFPGAVLIRSDRQLSVGAARNRAIDTARGRLIFFTDQDCVVPRDWIDRFEAHLADGTADAVGGAVGIRNPENASGSALYFLEFFRHVPRSGTNPTHKGFLVGCNLACRSTALQGVRFPDQTLAEDVLFSNDLHASGSRIVYDPSVVVLHQNREGWRTFFAYNHKMGRAAARYHAARRPWWAVPFLRFPALAFCAPVAILPSIAIELSRSHLSYLLRFLALAPMCLFGNLTWAVGFRDEVRESRDGVAAIPSDSPAS
jgi:glycosyltransferase involved in cell wall biosynthesis